jgi:hypothetical protein
VRLNKDFYFFDIIIKSNNMNYYIPRSIMVPLRVFIEQISDD